MSIALQLSPESVLCADLEARALAAQTTVKTEPEDAPDEDAPPKKRARPAASSAPAAKTSKVNISEQQHIYVQECCPLGYLAQLPEGVAITAGESAARLLAMDVCVCGYEGLLSVLWSIERFQCKPNNIGLLCRLPKPRQALLLPQRPFQHAACAAGAAAELATCPAPSVPEQPKHGWQDGAGEDGEGSICSQRCAAYIGQRVLLLTCWHLCALVVPQQRA